MSDAVRLRSDGDSAPRAESLARRASQYDRNVIRPTVARVDLHALRANYRSIVEFVGRERPAQPPGVIAVVKANAYGHGAGQVGRALEDAGARLLACADIEEGAALRAAGVRAEILVFGALSVSDLDGLFDCTLIPTISTPGAAQAVQAAAARYKQKLRYHLKIDTGMNRLGFRSDNLRRTLPGLLGSENLSLEGLYTHFATADVRSRTCSSSSECGSSARSGKWPRWAGRHRYRHAANSAAVLRDARVWFDLVRPGLLLYGIVPPPLASTLQLSPVMTLVSRVVAVKGMRAGEITGYGGRFTAERPTTIAIVPCGYADGLDLRLAGRGTVLIRGAGRRSSARSAWTC